MEPGNKIVDLSFLNKFTKGDSKKIKYFIEMHLKTAPKLFGEMEEKIDSIDYDELYSRAHSLKPQCSYVGIIGLKEKLVEIEDAVKDNKDRVSVKELVQKAIDLNKQGMAELGAFLEAEKVA